MSVTFNTSTQKHTHGVQAVLALLRGVPVAQVSARYCICRSDLYKFRRRALAAMEQALNEKPRGPKRPHNRLDEKREHTLTTLCQRYSTCSARQIAQKYGASAPSLRTIQRHCQVDRACGKLGP